MKLVHVIVEASRRGEYPRVGTREAKRIEEAVAQWLEQQELQCCRFAAKVIRDTR